MIGGGERGENMRTYTDNLEELLDSLIEKVNRTHRPVRLSCPSGNAVLVGEEEWRGMQETLRLHSVPGLAESVKDAARASGSVE